MESFTQVQDAYSNESKSKIPIVQSTEQCADEGGHGNRRPSRRFPRVDPWETLVEKLWLFEIIALAVSLVALLAIVTILRVTEGRRVPTWQIKPKHTKPLTVTINSVVSIFSTIVKSTVLIPVIAALGELKWIWFRQDHRLTDFQVFDSAAKGPLGAALMLWTFRGRNLACLGAMIVIGSLTLDFAFQQLITFPLKPVGVGQATIARTNEYSAFRPGYITGLKLPEIPMVAAVFKGMYGDNTTCPVTPGCTTGNCTWTEQYTSLGVCSKCYSTTNLIQKQCGTYNMTEVDENGDLTVVGDPVPYCNYTLPSGQSIAGIIGLESDSLPVVDVGINPASGDTYFGSTLTAHLATISVMRASWEQGANGFAPVDVNATECGLDLCVIKYKGNQQKSVFTEQVVDTFINTTDHSPFSTPEGGSTMPAVIQPPASWTNHSSANASNIYYVDPFTIQALQFEFSQTESPLWGGQYNDSFGSSASPSNDFVSYVRFMGDGGMETMMQSLATCMTQRMRRAPGAGTNLQGPGTIALGEANQDMPHVHVRWGWLALPATLLLLSAIFLAATVLEAKREGATMLWKTNSLAHFYHPLPDDGTHKLRDAYSAKHAEKIARDMRVRWEETEHGGRFVVL
ncbi:hypothetical protein A1O3_10178 [Capronia epimyces CBS 606.96]|uniref:Uncharacterized protein n=1 Tax=Capronia epimyces CBS 606.96 TaxID=1182542 RepID=W9XJ72_9EURO|nr:uncharacterized protein A1O3_10178 [Capronia epimyces CBS 606.96]EXJ77021.1 hypothetical protein A1O3_10178 [Capronia epimyces CBS 606.96]